MAEVMNIRYYGGLVHEHSISMRVIAYSFPHIQRAVDKIVMYENGFEMSKYSSLPPRLHTVADLRFDRLEDGSVIFPLSGAFRNLGSYFHKALSRPFTLAEQLEDQEAVRPTVRLRNIKGTVDAGGYEEVAFHVTPEDIERNKWELAKVGIAKDIDTGVSIVRAEGADSGIEFSPAGENVRSYNFNVRNAANFHRIVSRRELLDPMIYTGQLTGIKKTSQAGIFKYQGLFEDNVTGGEHMLYISSAEDKDIIRPYAVSDQDIRIWASPFARYGVRDYHRGDLMFIRMYG